MNSAIGYPLNCGTFSSSASYLFKKPSIGGDIFKLNATPITRIVSVSSTGIIYQDDLVLVQNSGSTTITDYETFIENLIPNVSPTISIYSNNSGIISGPDGVGIASGISSGSTSLVAIANDGSFSSVDVSVDEITGNLFTTLDQYASGSLSKDVSDAIDSRIDSLNASTAKNIFSSQDHSTPSYVRNTGCWTNDLDLTCISPWNSTGGTTRAGTLISPRHIIFAAHYQINNGDTIRFVDNNNNVVTRTVINKLTDPEFFSDGSYYPDLSVGVLDSDVPASISFAKILPNNFSDYLPSLSNSYPIPCLVLDQEEKALVSHIVSLGNIVVLAAPFLNEKRYEFFERIVGGDSGNPVFLIIDGELVIITVFTSGGDGGTGTNITNRKDTINNMMTALGGGYSLTEIDLSSFTDYSV